MSEHILRNESNTLRRTPNGTLARAGDGCCCGDDDGGGGGPCTKYSRARACYEILDSECNREIPPYIYFCAQRNGIGSVPPAGITSLQRGHCYTTTGEEFTLAQLQQILPPELIQQIRDLDDTIALTGCNHPACQQAPNVCGCVCFNYTTSVPVSGNIVPLYDDQGQWTGQCTPVGYRDTPHPSETWCCFGKTHPTLGLCWDFQYNEFREERVQFSGGGSGYACQSTESCCSSNAACIVSRVERRSIPGSVPCNQSGSGCGIGCGKAKCLEDRQTIQRYCDPQDIGIGSPWPLCLSGGQCVCSCPNQGSDSWNTPPNPTPDGPGTNCLTVTACVPVNYGTVIVVNATFPCVYRDVFDGCVSTYNQVFTYASTCNTVSTHLLETLYGAFTQGLPADQACDPACSCCCRCTLIQQIERRTEYLYSGTHPSDIECQQCLQTLVAAWEQSLAQEPIIPGSENDNALRTPPLPTPTGSIDNILFL